ncbi:MULTISPECIES: hypothetical protein [Alkalimonas]|uniref:Uncharacterized protein n=1 Tax=Alkalimonas mucilaginosa TaxID=3057676 RepID=A0ABU7JFE6_9GAMM|nr:hypothetical protein [Alkalimonas sp. MEB004]MEE2024156.1 hypothetical protein [Alkalimonas sp. MEB004]
MIMFSFQRQNNQWQRLWRQQQAAGPLQRILAWLVMGVLLVAGFFLILLMLLLSWLLIPLFYWRYRRKLRAFQQAASQAQQQYQQHSEQPRRSGHRVIEGEVVDRKEE